jgi:hypothetical protein
MTRADLTGEKIRLAFADDPSGKQFEEFFRRLLETERDRRHELGTTEVHGPTKFGKPDGGKDCSVTVRGAPRKLRSDFKQPLTWDEPGKTYYSLKTGNSWPQSVFGDVGYSGRLTGAKREKDKEPKPPTASEVLAHVATGNRYVIVVCEEADDGDGILEKVRRALAHHMARDGLSPQVGWEDRINFIDANVLAAFIRHHRPILPGKLEVKLGLDWPRTLDRFEEWTRRFGRDLPEYVPDQPREDFIESITNSGAARVVRVFGPPGVGKTRLVHRALERLDELDPTHLSRPTDSVYYTEDPAVVEDVIYSRWLRDDAGAVILVADEVGSSDAEALTRNFLARAPKDHGGRLVLIGVSDEDVYEGLDRSGDVLGVSLEELAPDATRRLVAAQLSDDKPTLVNQVLDLAEGYPLFAILLAQALDEDADALTRGDDPATRWEAAKRVLAGPRAHYGGVEAARRDEAVRRALCLLVVIMTGDQDLTWDALWESLGDDLRMLVAETCEWQRVKTAEAECVARGLLRLVGSSNKRYVSPANLARMILNHFFGDGPHDLGPRLVRCDARLQDRIHAMARRFGASRNVCDKLSRGLLAEFERRRVAGESLAALIDTRNALHLAAERFPDAAARVLSAAILEHEHEVLVRKTQLRHGLRSVFEELVQMPLSQAAFAELEAALFAMARAEDQRWANNATGIWRSLFLVASSQTHQPWSVRFGMLAQRCREGSEVERVLAIGALALAVASDERGLGHAPGREWPRPTEAAYRARKREAWELLLELCAGEQAAVAAAAREVVADKLRGCIMDDVAVDAALLRELGERLDSWNVAQRRRLAETLADVRRYDYSELDADLRSAIDELEVRLDPSDFHERLVAQVGSWHPGPWAIDDPQREQLEAQADEALVSDALAQPQQLVAQWPWLASNAAVRRRPFMRALGHHDSSRHFLPTLETYARQGAPLGTQLLAWYVEGWSQATRADADAWLDGQLAGGPYEDVAGFVLPFLEPSDQRLEWLVDRVERGSAHVPTLSALRYRWVAKTSAPTMLRLVEACAAQAAECVPIGISLSVELLGLELAEQLLERALNAAETLLERATDRRLPDSGEHAWYLLLLELSRRGRIEASIDATLGLITSDANIGSRKLINRSLRALFEQNLAQQLWRRAQAQLDGDKAETITWHLAHAQVLSWLPTADVLDWVAEFESRGVSAMSLVNPYGDALPDLARGLLRRFGDEGLVAATLTARAWTTPRAVNSLLDFKRRQLANIERWAQDNITEVRRWAERLAAQFRQDIAESEAHEMFRRKLG